MLRFFKSINKDLLRTSFCNIVTRARRTLPFSEENGQKGVIHLIPLFLLLVGIIAGVYLVSHPQIFKPKASSQNIEIQAADGKDQNGNDCRVYEESGKKKTNCDRVKLKIISPEDAGQTSDAGFQLIKAVNAQGSTDDFNAGTPAPAAPTEGDRYFCKEDHQSKIYWYGLGFMGLSFPELSKDCGKDQDGHELFCADREGGGAACKVKEEGSSTTQPSAARSQQSPASSQQGQAQIEGVEGAKFITNGVCSDDNKNKIYKNVSSDGGASTNKEEVATCPSGLRCKPIGGNAVCADNNDNPVIEGSEWSCSNQGKIHKGGLLGFIGDTNIDCQGETECHQDGDGDSRKVYCKGAGGQPGGGGEEKQLKNVSPEKDAEVSVAANQPSISFKWEGPKNTKNYKLIINAAKDDRVDGRNDCPQDIYSQYYICVDIGQAANVDVLSKRFKNGGSYHWWVDAFSDNRDKKTSVGTDFKVSKTGVIPPPAIPRPTAVTPTSAGPTVCNNTAAIDMPSAANTPNNNKWVLDCNSSCKDTQKHTDCPTVQNDAFICPSSSRWCYDFGGDVGKKCLHLEYTGPRTGPPPGAPGGPACPERQGAAPAAISPTAPGAAGGTGTGGSPPQSPAAEVKRVTKYFKVAESPGEFNGPLNPYTPGGVSAFPYSFKPPVSGPTNPKTIFVQFYDDKGVVINVRELPYAVSDPIEYVKEQPSGGGAPAGAIPAGSACSTYEVTSVCGGGIKTYDKCTDDKGQSGDRLCSGTATKFYCIGSTNSNCDSSNGTGQGNYYCSACSNLAGRGSGGSAAGGACSSYETYGVCTGVLTYDKCTDDKGQTGSQLCSGTATKFYCQGSGNSNCDSRYDGSQNKVLEGTYNYACSSCSNLAGRASRSQTSPIIASCAYTGTNRGQVAVGDPVTFSVNPDGGTGQFTYIWGGDVSGSSREVTKSFDTTGYKQAFVQIFSGGLSTTATCGNILVTSSNSNADRNTQSVTIPAGSDCSAYETTSVCGGNQKTYDKCIDNLRQSGLDLCTRGAGTFYCVGSTNSNCDSSGGTGVGNYSCSGCPNLSNR